MPLGFSPSSNAEDISENKFDNSIGTSDISAKKEVIPAEQPPPPDRWTRDLASLRGMGDALLETLEGVICGNKPLCDGSRYHRMFGEKEPPADAYLSLGGFTLKMHEQDARRAADHGDPLTLNPAIPLSKMEADILKRCLERITG